MVRQRKHQARKPKAVARPLLERSHRAQRFFGPLGDIYYQERYEKANTLADKTQILFEYLKDDPEGAGDSDWFRGVLAILPAVRHELSLPPEPRVLKENFGKVTNELRTPEKLPPQKMDLSQYLDGADLTERQRECISLRLEYGIPVVQIARRLNLSRATVQEHIERAIRNVDLARTRERSAKKRARRGPESFPHRMS